MSRRLLVAVSALLCSLVFLNPSPAQGLRPAPADEQPSAERRLEALQKQVEALTKELEGLRKGVSPKVDASNMAEAAFRQMDRNADGLLDYDEMSDTLKAEYKKWDTNKDGLIDLNEFKAYYKVKLAEQEARTKEPTPAEKTETRAFSLKFSNAPEIAKALQELFGTGEKRLRLAVDEKANKIFATGSAIDLITVQSVLTKLDTAPEQPKAAGNSSKPDFQVFKLRYIEAASIASTLQSLFADPNKSVRIVAEPISNTVLIQASPADLTKVLAVIEKLDVAIEKKSTATTGETASWKIFTLKRAEAVDMAALLTKLFPRDQVRLAADARSNSLVVFARSEELMTIEAILSRLDEATGKKSDTRPTP